MANIVIALVGEGGNGLGESQSRRFLDLMRPMGLEGQVLGVADPDFASRLQELLNKGVLFGWSCDGVGARLTRDGRNVWDAAGVPFVSVLGEAPYIAPANHYVASPYVINGYLYREWLEMQDVHFRSPQVSTLLPMGILPNPASHLVPWSQRPRRMLFAKNGADPAKRRANWDKWPARLRTVLHECADALTARSPGPIAPVVENALAAHSLVLDRCKPILFGLLHELDTYIRALRATVMARALLPLPVDIVGDGWDHVRSEPGRARFHPPIPAAELDREYAETQIVVEVTPNFGSGPHAGVLRGFAACCCVVSDNNEYARSQLQRSPAYYGVEWQAPDLAERLAVAFNDLHATEEEREDAQLYVQQRYSPVAFITRVAELAQLARMRSVFAEYALDAA